ncbi:transcriptional coactivator/pterin dehydratase [Xylariaceae sp. FL0662B]|nr:transcriptional coactivator/pterin dehydratase [Xylariaceae sp. FL0662B]
MHARHGRFLLRRTSAAVTASTALGRINSRVPRCVPATITNAYLCGLTHHHTGSRTLVSSARTMASSTTSQARFSAGADEAALSQALKPLLRQQGGRWTLIPGGEGLERSFKFKTFAKTWDFMTAVSLQCKLKNHHPEWSNVYNTTYIRWTTHDPKGLSAKDVELAAVCDGLARDFGEIAVEPSSSSGDGDSCSLKQVADRAVTGAGDCCTPKKT